VGDKAEIWRAIGRELEDVGITLEAFDANKELIIDWFHRLSSEQGIFGEPIADDTSIVIPPLTLPGELQNSRCSQLC
jgi:hypothetical protein